MRMSQNYFKNRNSNTKEISIGKTQILSKTLRFSRQQQIQLVKLFKFYIERTKKLDRIIFFRTGTYLLSVVLLTKMASFEPPSPVKVCTVFIFVKTGFKYDLT